MIIRVENGNLTLGTIKANRVDLYASGNIDITHVYSYVGAQTDLYNVCAGGNLTIGSANIGMSADTLNFVSGGDLTVNGTAYIDAPVSMQAAATSTSMARPTSRRTASWTSPRAAR